MLPMLHGMTKYGSYHPIIMPSFNKKRAERVNLCFRVRQSIVHGTKKANIPFDRRSGCYDCYAPLKRIFRPKSACGKPRRDIYQANDENGAAYYKAEGLKELLKLKPAALKRRLKKNLNNLLLDETSSPLELWGKGKLKPLHKPDYNAAI